jgi:hypothetical protein
LRLCVEIRGSLRLAVTAAVLAVASPAGAEGSSLRVLPPGAAPIVARALGRAAPALAMKGAQVSADHVDAVMCAPDGRCYELRLDDPRGGCAGRVAGPFCVRFTGESPGAAAEEAVARGFAAEAPDACWQEIVVRDDPVEQRDPTEGPRGGGPSFRAWLLLTVAPAAAGALLGWIAARIRGRAFVSRKLAVAVVGVTTLLGCIAALRQLALGIWDLALAGALLGLGAVVTAYRLPAALRSGRAALAAASTAASLLVAEVAVRALAPPPPGVDPAELTRLYLDPHEADVAHKRFELWTPGGPEGGWTSVLRDALYPGPDARFFVEREGDAARFRGARRRVLHLGDSMVYGLGVERAEAFPAQLEALEPGTVHVNSGIPGLAPDVELLLMRRWLERTSFDLVVVHLFTGNDVIEMDTAFPFCGDGPLLDYESSPPRARCPAPSSRFARSRLSWMLAHSPPPYALRALAGSSQLARRSALGLLALRTRVLGAPRDEEVSWTHIEAVLRAFRDELGARKIPLVVDVLPLRDALEARDPSITEAFATRGRMVEMAEGMGIMTLDPWSLFEEEAKRGGPGVWSTAMMHDLHFGPRGNALFAHWLHERLPAAP